MGCKHRKAEGNTTKYFVCGVFGKNIDDYSCRDCMMKIEEDNSNNQINKIFEQIFGKGFSG